MATGTRALTLKLLADVDNFTKGLNSADNHVTTFGEKVADYGKKAALAFAAVGAAAIAASVDMVKNAAADQAAQRTLAKTLENTTQATKAQVAAVEDYITKTSLAKGITDDELRPAFARLTRSTQDVKKSQDLLNLAMDVASATGKPLESITNALGKAYDGNSASLGRLGLGIDSSILKSQDFDKITTTLKTNFKGFAEQEANTFEGKLRRLQIAFDEGKETIGTYILEAITPMVEILVKNVIPAIQEFTSNIGEKLAPVIKIFRPIIEGLRFAFNSIRDSLQENNDELRQFFKLLKNIADFVVKYVGPAISETLGLAFKALGKIIATIIDQFSDFVSSITKIYNTIKGIIDLIKGAGSAVGNFFSGASYSGATTPAAPAAPSAPTPAAPSVPRYVYASTGNTNITVNGAIDTESTARQIVSILNDSSARGTLGGNLIYA
jgi:phage-related protein